MALCCCRFEETAAAGDPALPTHCTLNSECRSVLPSVACQLQSRLECPPPEAGIKASLPNGSLPPVVDVEPDISSEPRGSGRTVSRQALNISDVMLPAEQLPDKQPGQASALAGSNANDVEQRSAATRSAATLAVESSSPQLAVPSKKVSALRDSGRMRPGPRSTRKASMQDRGMDTHCGSSSKGVGHIAHALDSLSCSHLETTAGARAALDLRRTPPTKGVSAWTCCLLPLFTSDLVCNVRQQKCSSCWSYTTSAWACLCGGPALWL